MKASTVRARRRLSRAALNGARVSYRLDDDDPQVVLAGSHGSPLNLWVYRPEARHLLPEAGAWAMVVRPLPPLERDLHDEVLVGHVFYAERSTSNTDAEGFQPDGTYSALLRTPHGEVRVWPYEYATVSVADLMAMQQAGEMVFNPVASSVAQFNDVVFYARSRGIALGDAMAMALGTLQGYVGWFEPAAALAEKCRAMGQMLGRAVGTLTAENHERRAAARRRMR